MTVRMANGVNDNSVVCREKNRECRVLTTMYEALGRWCMWDFAGAQSGLEVNACCILKGRIYSSTCLMGSSDAIPAGIPLVPERREEKCC